MRIRFSFIHPVLLQRDFCLSVRPSVIEDLRNKTRVSSGKIWPVTQPYTFTLVAEIA
jgi:hypothetical protein